jgi:predicted branched-subunit amino acid permease
MAVSSDLPPMRAAFFAGVRSALTSVFFLVLAGTYVGVGALAHDFGFSVWWLLLSTVLIWAAPAQVIVISSLGGGAALFEVAIAVTLSAVRLFPMVVALLPLLRSETTRARDLLLPAHYTSVSMWVESLRLLPTLPQDRRRVAFCNGLSVGYQGSAIAFGFVGFYLAAGLPALFAGALLFLTPLSFLMSTARNSRQLIERVAFVSGLLIAPPLAWYHVELDLMWSGLAGGLIGYAVHRLRGALTS